MTSANSPRSVFGSVDQERVLAGFDRAVDDGLDSNFFDTALSQAQEAAIRAELDADLIDFDRLDAASRREFVLHGPGGSSDGPGGSSDGPGGSSDGPGGSSDGPGGLG